MREKPILFSTPMVQAILARNKTMTRRVVNSKGNGMHYGRLLGDWGLSEPPELKDGVLYWELQTDVDDSRMFEIKCPWKVGQILWVRETWKIGAWNENIGSIVVDYKADNLARREWLHIEDENAFEKYWIQSTDDVRNAGLLPDEERQYHWKVGEAPTRWRPSIFMPRRASRIFLKVKSIRVERLQEITEEDAEAEGCQNQIIGDDITTIRQSFEMLWNKLNAKRGYGWGLNPWVWVVGFERVGVLTNV